MEGCNCICFVYHGPSLDSCDGKTLEDFIAIGWKLFESYVTLLDEVKVKADLLKYGVAAVAFYVPNTSISTIICASTIAGMATLSLLTNNYEVTVICSVSPVSNGFTNALWMVFTFFNTVLSGLVLAPILLAINGANIVLMCVSKIFSLLFFGMMYMFQKFTGTVPPPEPTESDVMSVLQRHITLVPMKEGEVRIISYTNMYGTTGSTSRPTQTSTETDPLLDLEGQNTSNTTSTATSIDERSDSSPTPQTSPFKVNTSAANTPTVAGRLSGGRNQRKGTPSTTTTVPKKAPSTTSPYGRDLGAATKSQYGSESVSGGSPTTIDTTDDELVKMFATMKVSKPITQADLVSLVCDLMEVRKNRFCFIRCLQAHDQVLFINEMTRLLYVNNREQPEVMIETISLGTMLMADWRFIMTNIQVNLSAVYQVWRYAYWGESAGRLSISDSKTMYMVLVDTIDGNPGQVENLLYSIGHIKPIHSFKIRKSASVNHKADEKFVWQEIAS